MECNAMINNSAAAGTTDHPCSIETLHAGNDHGSCSLISQPSNVLTTCSGSVDGHILWLYIKGIMHAVWATSDAPQPVTSFATEACKESASQHRLVSTGIT